jgi:hypothetical protein
MHVSISIMVTFERHGERGSVREAERLLEVGEVQYLRLGRLREMQKADYVCIGAAGPPPSVKGGQQGRAEQHSAVAVSSISWPLRPLPSSLGRPFGAQLDPAASRPRPCLELLIRLDFKSVPHALFTVYSTVQYLVYTPPACARAPDTRHSHPCRAQLAIARAFGSIKPRRSSLNCPPPPSRSSSFAALDEPGRPLSQPHLLPQQCAHHLQFDFLTCPWSPNLQQSACFPCNCS